MKIMVQAGPAHPRPKKKKKKTQKIMTLSEKQLKQKGLGAWLKW
jgi:hypothetical protein